MYRVLIVDDEPIVRKGLRETIEWDNLDMEISGEACNGVEAMDIIGATPPHILITDVKMPEMDGMELVRAIRKRGLNIKVIILSGYSDYAYLKEAIKLGVDSYLLKPIDNDELSMNLTDAVKSIEKTGFQTTQQSPGTELLKANVMNRLVTNGISMREFEEKATFLGIALEAKRYLCAVCLADFLSRGLSDDAHLSLAAIKNACDERLQRSGVSFVDARGRIVLLFFGEDADTLRDAAQTALDSVVSYVSGPLGMTIFIGAGTQVSTLDTIWKSYDSAAKCLDYSVFIENSGVLWHDAVAPSDPQDTMEIHVNYGFLRSLVKSGKKDLLFSYLDEIFSVLSSSHAVSVDYIRNFIMKLAIEIIRYFQITENTTDVSTAVDFDYAALLTIRRVKAFKEWLYQLCEKLFAETTSLQGKNRGAVHFVVSHIEENYWKGISLKQIAALYHVNTSYLGQIFKKEMGESFTSYINGYRIQKAKELLACSGLKVYEIAEKVGFTDYYYFLKIFKKIAGANPSEMRR